jgi:hypothetical protein
MCSLFRLQNRFLKGDFIEREKLKKLLPKFDDKYKLLPILSIVLHMTHLLINPCWGSAWQVLEAVVGLGGIHVFVTPHWVYRAGIVLVQNLDKIYHENFIRLYSNALFVLDLSSWKWPSSIDLRSSLEEHLTEMKKQLKPTWANKVTHGGITI